ncbi:MAG: 50S ribosomal protein L9 [Spirochaetaceae bacterium]|nr:50S ribosomal protein L9 [Spirochaetaceae bacterium]
MKVILNKDISPLGEEGDVKEVAKGYARNFLFPRRIAVPYTERTIKLFEARKEEIEERKALKRQDASGLKERLEGLELSITMPAGANGKLYGAVTSQTVMDELAKQGFQIERKRIEIPGNSIKNVGKYKFTVKLYGNLAAELTVAIIAQEIKPSSRTPHPKDRRRRSDESRNEAALVEAAASSNETASGSEAASGEEAASGGEAVSGNGTDSGGEE